MYNIDEIKNKIICGDCLEVMKEIPDNSIDTIITDPPYGLNFMGKGWDNFGTDLQKYQEWTRRWAIEALRIAKLGATLLCFGSPRTYHRLTCAIEDAGWIIKDCIMWLYGSGFPKATDIAKQLAKKQGAKKQGAGSKGNTFPLNKEYQDYELTPEAKQWEGWKSHGLKPAWEPIIMAMKPNEGSYAENALKFGVAGLNIDGSRIKSVDWQPNRVLKKYTGNNKGNNSATNNFGVKEIKCINPVSTIKGRFPANLILSEEAAEILDQQSGVISFGNKEGGYSYRGKRYKVKGFIGNNTPQALSNYGDTGGGASRFFYVSKANRAERNMECEGAYILKENTPEKIKKEIEKYLTTIKTDDILKE